MCKKIEAVKRLQKLNIPSVEDHGIVVIFSDTYTMETIKPILKQIEYGCSYSVRPLHCYNKVVDANKDCIKHEEISTQTE